jgi:prenyltransferase beta subunit
MRLSFALLLLLRTFTFAQPTAEQNEAAVKWVTDLQAPDSGFYLTPRDANVDVAPKPMLRATHGAVRALKCLGREIPNKEKHAAFVLKCYDPKTGTFAEPGGKPDGATTSTGVMTAIELGIPRERFANAMNYLKENTRTFEDVRIASAAVEAWGVKDCPFDLKPWVMVATDHLKDTPLDISDGGARELGSVIAIYLRLGEKGKFGDSRLLAINRPDGGWCKAGEKASDIVSTYHVMRALALLKEKPKDAKKLREFIDSHRNKDGGYATKPGDKSSMNGVYYAVIISKWLDELEARK